MPCNAARGARNRKANTFEFGLELTMPTGQSMAALRGVFEASTLIARGGYNRTIRHPRIVEAVRKVRLIGLLRSAPVQEIDFFIGYMHIDGAKCGFGFGSPHGEAADLNDADLNDVDSRTAALVHFLSGSYRARRSAVQATARSLDFGLGGALAARPCLSRRSAVFGDVVPNDGTRRPMENAFGCKCLDGEKSEKHRDNENPA
jgi:hypothetical protein